MTPYQIMIARHKHEKNAVMQFQMVQEDNLKGDYDYKIANAQNAAQKRQLRAAYSAAKRQLRSQYKVKMETMKARHAQERESIKRPRL